MRVVFLLLISLTITSCSVDPFPYNLEQINVPESGVKSMVIGDWGRKGHVNLKANAFMMNEVACRVSINFILTTGDNFYSNGVNNTDDSHWNRSFENIFTGECLTLIPWFPSLGNHDVRGNTDAQIAYSNESTRWNMPATYYDYWVEEDSVSVHFIAVDTSPFVDSYHDDPSNSQMDFHVSNADTTRQLAWLDSVLGSGTPDWTVVYGHHPVYAAEGRHGETEELIEKFVPIFDHHQLDVYFCGHNHSLELIKTDTKTLYVTSGGGSNPQSRIENKPYNLFGVADAGFVLSSFAKDSLQLDFISKRGEVLYRYVNPQTP
ncbi:MAG: tartrate-resistant acid phosphatase type 5 [Bacteroidia bacterium]|jgi:tartrate-resistant acid phosphatase type 5